MKEALAPLQFGVGVSDGATVVYRGVEALLSCEPGVGCPLPGHTERVQHG